MLDSTGTITVEKLEALIEGTLNEQALAVLIPTDDVSILPDMQMRAVYNVLAFVGLRDVAEARIEAWLADKTTLSADHDDAIARLRAEPPKSHTMHQVRSVIRAAAALFHPALRAKMAEEQKATRDATAERVRKEVEAAADEHNQKRAARVAELNEKYQVVNDRGKVLVVERPYDPMLNRFRIQAMRFEDFEKLFRKEQIQVGFKKNRKGEDVPEFMGVGSYWLKHPDRKTYDGGLILDPSGKVARPNQMNLWRGFNVEPREGSCIRFREHLLNNICGGVEEHFNYFWKWCARAVQFPDQPGEVALVMRGGKGSGKGWVARTLMRLFGQHGMQISSSEHLVGKHNAHLEDCIFLFADEAFFAGAKADIGKLNRLITEPTMDIEPKFRDMRSVPNFLHIVMASNEKWVVPASLDERRYFVLDVLGTKVGDFGYFRAIRDELESGGYAALLYDLLRVDLTDFNVRDVPVTEALNRQKELSLDTTNKWWLECLHRGYVWESKGQSNYFGEWHDEMATEQLLASYLAYAKRVNERDPLSPITHGVFMTKVSVREKRLKAGAVVAEKQTEAGWQAITKPKRTWGYVLGTLAEARKKFEEETKLPFKWPGDGSEEPDDDGSDKPPF
ncbi:MAG: hypothetical protein J0H44_13610 [Alphaproteobacteria bacterium]|nr:hypothetical protein [Alphaproteobacteria bacterium]